MRPPQTCKTPLTTVTDLRKNPYVFFEFVWYPLRSPLISGTLLQSPQTCDTPLSTSSNMCKNPYGLLGFVRYLLRPLRSCGTPFTIILDLWKTPFSHFGLLEYSLQSSWNIKILFHDDGDMRKNVQKF